MLNSALERYTLTKRPKITQQPSSQKGPILGIPYLIRFSWLSEDGNLGPRKLFVRTLGTWCLILSRAVFIRFSHGANLEGDKRQAIQALAEPVFIQS